MMNRIGIDLGGTKIEGVVLDEQGKQLARHRIPTCRDRGYEGILEKIETVYRAMTAGIEGAPHTLGVGMPGSINRHTGLLRNSNTLSLNGKPLRADLEQRLGRPLAMQNDANCFAAAEAISGAAAGRDLVFGVIMGTGCGGGIVYRGQVIEGLQAIAGEWGHTSVDPNGSLCWCGARGCIETLISGAGLEQRYEEIHGARRPLPEIVESYRRNEKDARAFMESFFDNFGRCLANVINILDPDMVVLGGGLSNIDELYTEGVRAVGEMIFCDRFDTPIVKNRLGDSAGVIGAAWIGV